ncbi:MAG TPA: type IV toxin-antitoxin system AbiEi family antitoxin domain-containing protein, partial [Microlunatus sp.]|nr:type IV toxin-antitoxin system AbiEi family antitoxin domain-containing protein [Microlunatus sp.]
MAEVRRAAELLGQGVGHAELARMARSGEIRRVRRGGYAFGPELGEFDDGERHRELIEASMGGLCPD